MNEKVVVKCNQKVEPLDIQKQVEFSIYYSGSKMITSFSLQVYQGVSEVWNYKDDNGLHNVVFNIENRKENERYYVKTILFSNGQYVCENNTYFETGFYPKKACWIKGEKVSDSVFCFKKSFKIDEQIEYAKLFVCGLGFYNFAVNRKKYNKEYYTPNLTDYSVRNIDSEGYFPANRHTIIPQYYDVTKDLKLGNNILSFYVGNGYYQNTDKYLEPNFSFGEKKIIFELVVRLKNNQELVLFSNRDTKLLELPMSSTLYIGDRIDFSKSSTKEVGVVESNEIMGEWRTEKLPADTINEKIYPILKKKKSNSVLYDFERNHSGGLSIEIKGEKGQKITIYYAEILNNDGSLNLETSGWKEEVKNTSIYQEVYQKTEYVLSGKWDKICPLFSWFCYRYVLIEGVKNTEIRKIYSNFIYQKTESDNSIKLSNEILEEIVSKGKLTIKDNSHCGIISDCPHREKRPYTGDMQAISETMLYAFSAVSLYEKILNDIIDSQQDNGYIPNTTPHLNGGGGYAWGNAISIIPNELYNFTGNIEYAKKAYGPIQKWLGYCLSNRDASGKVLNSGSGWTLSDWMTPGIAKFNIPLMNTFCTYQTINVLIHFAKVLGYEKDYIEYSNLLKNVHDDILLNFYNRNTHDLAEGIQGENLYGIKYDIFTIEDKVQNLEKLESFYKDNNYQIDTGFLMTPILFDVLFENSLEEVAYKILTSKENISFYNLLKGETTFSENWLKKWPDYYTCEGHVVKGGGDLSHCHPLYTSIISRIYKYVVGLNLSSLGERVVVFSPRVIRYLDNAEATVLTQFGKIKCAWEKKEKFKANIIIPFGLKFKVNIKDGIKGDLIAKKEDKIVVIKNAEIENFDLECGNWKIEEKL